MTGVYSIREAISSVVQVLSVRAICFLSYFDLAD